MASFWNPPPLWIFVALCGRGGGGCMDIFSNYTLSKTPFPIQDFKFKSAWKESFRNNFSYATRSNSQKKLCPTYCTSSQRQALSIFFIRINHAKLDGELSLFISNDWIRKFTLTTLAVVHNILNPTLMRFNTIARQGNEFYTSLFKLWSQICHTPQLSGAYRSVVSRVREEDCPTDKIDQSITCRITQHKWFWNQKPSLHSRRQ